MKIANRANIEWKYEFKKQENLLKKQIEISLKRAEFDNMSESEQKKLMIKERMMMMERKDNQKNNT